MALPSSAEIRLPDWLMRLAPPQTPEEGGAMAFAIDLAHRNVAEKTGGPFAALILESATGRIVSAGVNLVAGSGDPVRHAEVVAISLAAKAGWPEAGATLIATCEPCIMCLGAAHWARVTRIVSAAARSDAEAIGFHEGAGCGDLHIEMAARGVVFASGLMRSEAAAVLRAYRGQGGVIYGPPAS